MVFNATSYLIQDKPANILAILQRVKFEDDQLRRHSMPPDAKWLEKAEQEIVRYLTSLSQAFPKLWEYDQYVKFPTEELKQLRTTLDEMVAAPYQSHAQVPVLEKVTERPCEKLIQELIKMQVRQPHSTPCAKVSVNIKIDELGRELYEVALNGQEKSVEKYVEFTRRSGWCLLRNYLLHAITFQWSEKASVLQYKVLLEIIAARDHVRANEITVSAFWHSLEDRNHQQMHRPPETSLMKVLQDYMKGGGEAFPQISQEHVNPTYSWDHKQLSVRKRMVYGYRS